MDKEKLIGLAGGVTALASLLGITRQAVSKWHTVPPLQVYRLREMRPRWFRKASKRA